MSNNPRGNIFRHVGIYQVCVVKSTEVEMETESVMDLVPFQAPRLAGSALSFFAALTRLPGLGSILLNKVKTDNQFHVVCEFASTLDNMPVYLPLRPPTADVLLEHSRLASSFSLDDLAKTVINPPKDGAFHRWTIQDYTQRYRDGTTTPLDVITTVLALIEASNNRSPPLRAFIQVNRELALQEAQASTERYASGNPVGVLDGVPIGVKDELAVIGYTASCGTNFVGRGEVATEDALPIARLRRAGAIVVGMTNMHEIGCGTLGVNITHGTPRNPHNDQYMTGGSSSGSAAAVAAGLVPLAIGLDGGGSVRIPAALCGVVALKATYMRVPFNIQALPTLCNACPLAGTVQDAALAYAVMSGADPSVKPSLVQPPPFVLAPTKDLGKLRVGVFTPYAEPSLLRGYRSTIEQLKELGAEVIEVEIPHLNAIHLSHNITSLKEFVDFYDRYPISSFSLDVQINLGVGNVVDALEYLAAQKVRGYAMQVTEEMFDQVDIFLTPATAQLAPRLDRDVFKAGLSDLATTTALMRFIILGNMVGIPGLTVPVAYDMETNLPISVLLQAIHWNEHKLFAVARHLEAHMLSKEPSVYYSVLNA
ncbi:hypothetical protein AeMF1_012104 [Aphanomyces euteiches]|nr:hypothetical protein AeMF1_012104 [Aphanomyces euteiches]